jgi:hypothetical protein
MRLVYVIGLGLLVCSRISGQSQPAVAGEYAAATPGGVYTCSGLSSGNPYDSRTPVSADTTGEAHEWRTPHRIT